MTLTTALLAQGVRARIPVTDSALGEAEPGATPLPVAIRASLQAKMERLLCRPLIADVVRPPGEAQSEIEAALPNLFRLLAAAAETRAPTAGLPRARPAWREQKDGTWCVSLDIDYADLWRGAEKEVLDVVNATVENKVTFLTDEQRRLLERSPREFLELLPRPEFAELVSFRKETIGGSERVVELTIAEPPRSPEAIRSIAIVPNLVPFQRQLDALRIIERGEDDGPVGPLRALLGLSAAPAPVAPETIAAWQAPPGTRLDEFQADCVRKALRTPHFAVIKGPPGSGKTTVITNIIRDVTDAGGKVLVVSPTHVAVDNVVEKLVAAVGDHDDLAPATLPVRYAARSGRLLPGAAQYWVGPKKQNRGATVGVRVEKLLRKRSALAQDLFRRVDPKISGIAQLTVAITNLHRVICGTPIGILSFDTVKQAAVGTFDLLVVDEVSKMTLPEFLAIAVKAKRWVLVGDPEQLPPFNNAEENGTTLDDIMPPALELVASVGAFVERRPPAQRSMIRLLVVARDPYAAACAIQAHLQEVDLRDAPTVDTHDAGNLAGILVCSADQIDEASARLAGLTSRDRTHRPDLRDSVDVLVERGLRAARPEVAGGSRFVEPRCRAPAAMFDTAFSVYHAQPWGIRAKHRLGMVGFRNGIAKSLPSVGALRALSPDLTVDEARNRRGELVNAIATRFAVNTVSVFDWLVGIPAEHFDVEPLQNLAKLGEPLAPLRSAVHPFVGTLKKQYRMHPSLSRVPRELFYFEEALLDGGSLHDSSCRVRLVQIPSDRAPGERNLAEANEIARLLGELGSATSATGRAPTFLVITPYRDQERLLKERVDALRARNALDGLDVEVCTLDRCQGREADYVFASLVRNRATPFMDAPKRWNVALTRAMQGLFIVGDVDSYLDEARRGRANAAADPDPRPKMSLLARILEAYNHQLHIPTHPSFKRTP